MMAYSDPKRASDPHALPDVEVWYNGEKQAKRALEQIAGGGTPDFQTEPGFYWWTCFPGCLPDSDPSGPFATEAEALADAQSQAE